MEQKWIIFWSLLHIATLVCFVLGIYYTKEYMLMPDRVIICDQAGNLYRGKSCNVLCQATAEDIARKSAMAFLTRNGEHSNQQALEALFGRSNPTRYGNAIEIYGGCDYFKVDNCYIYQIYDAAITHQHQGDTDQTLVMKNITYSNNLVEDCVYSIEYFLSRADTNQSHYMENILICDNILRRSGFGWGSQRPDKQTPAHIKSWGHHYNRASRFVVRNNVFDRGTFDLLNISANRKEWLPTLSENTYIQYRGGKAGLCGSEGITYTFDDTTSDMLRELFAEKHANVVFVEQNK